MAQTGSYATTMFLSSATAVGKLDSLPVSLLDLLGDSGKLALDDLLSVARLALLELLANAGNHLETSDERSLDLVGDNLVGLAKEGTALRVTENDPVDVGVFELVGRDFTSEGARGLGVAVLRRDLDGLFEGGLDLEKVERGRGDDDL